MVDEKELDVVNSVKILSITLSSDLKWNVYINETIKDANKRLYFLHGSAKESWRKLLRYCQLLQYSNKTSTRILLAHFSP